MKKTVLTFGVISGVIISALMLVTFQFKDALGYDRGEVIGYTSMVLAFLLIFFGVRSYRDNVAGGTVRFGRAFAVGALIAIVSSTFYVGMWELIYYKLQPDFMSNYQAHVLEKAQKDGATPEAIASRKAEMEKFAEMYKNPVVNIAFTFLEPLPVALIVSLVSAGVLSRRRKSAPGGNSLTTGVSA